jgi:hypothetical protein
VEELTIGTGLALSGGVVTANGAVSGNAPTYVAVANAATATLDFSAGQTIGVLSGLSQNLTISTSNLSAGRVYGLRLKDDGTSRTLTFPAWTWLTGAPTATTALKWIVITLECTSGVDGGVLADWKTQP